MICRRKPDQFKNEECSLDLQYQHKKSGWYVDNSCLNPMKGGKNRFWTLKKDQDGSFLFGNDNPTRIIGRGIVKLGSKDDKKEIVERINVMIDEIDVWKGK
jgi:hypothetical protein